jgi:hypothetical protein
LAVRILCGSCRAGIQVGQVAYALEKLSPLRTSRSRLGCNAELPSAAMVSNRCWSVMINSISGRAGDVFVMLSREHLIRQANRLMLSHKCHSERSEEL